MMGIVGNSCWRLMVVLAVTVLIALSECSPRGKRGHLHQEVVAAHQQQPDTPTISHLQAPTTNGTTTPDSALSGTLEEESQQGDSNYTMKISTEKVESREKGAEVQGGAELLQHLLQSGDSLLQGGRRSHLLPGVGGALIPIPTEPAGTSPRRSGSKHNSRSERRPGGSKQGASRELLNALREHRHQQRYQQLERLQTVPEPEKGQHSSSGGNSDVTSSDAGIVGFKNENRALSSSPGGVSPEALGLLPSSMVRISGGSGSGHRRLVNSLLPQSPLLKGQGVNDNIAADDVIKGSRRAFNITKLEYLKKEWCKTERFRQVVREEGCLRRVIINRFCYGQCNSFFIPKSNKHDPNSAAFRACAFCRPRRTFSVTVTLICPGRRQRFRKKKIDVVKECKCMAQRFDE